VAAVEELRMLSNFQLEDHALLQSFLVGQPEFRDIMQGAEMQQLRQRVIASYHLGPLDAEETRSYVEHRLRHVGWADDPRFDPGAFNIIYGYTGGIPRRINTLCDRLLLGAFLAERHIIAEQNVREVIDELKDEFATPRKREPEPAPRQGAGALDVSTLALDRLRVSDAMVTRAAGLTAATEIQRLEARLVGLEQSVSATHDILNQLLQAVRKEEPPAGDI